MTALAGLPLALLAGLLAELAAGALIRGPAEPGPLTVILGLRKRTARTPLGLLPALGALGSLAGAGVVGAAVIGAIPGGLPTVALGLVATTWGAHLARGGDLVPAALAFDAVALVAVVAAFVRWRAADLEAIRGAQAVLGPGVVVGSTGRVAALVLAAVALAVAGGARAPDRPEGTTPPEAALAVALTRWAVLGATAMVVGAVAAGPEIGTAGSWSSAARAIPAWIGGTVAAAALAGVAWRVAGRIRTDRRPALIAAAILAVAVAASFVLGAS
jgi:hypothetical protein